MPKQKITGSFVALITPFNKDGSVDFAAFQTLLRFQEQHGTKAVLIMGSTGETSMLSPEEKKKADEHEKMLVQKNNAAVDELQANVGKFNDQLKAYKAAQASK